MQAAKREEMRHLSEVDRFKRYGRQNGGTDLSICDQSIGNDETNTFQLKFFI